MKALGSFARAVAALSTTTILSGIAVAQMPAPAANANQAGFDDIIVTARRAAETAQSVPMSITAFSADTLRQQNITSANDLNKAVPGLTVAFSQANPAIPAFAIRGRGLNYGAAAGAVETYFADVPLSMPTQAFTLPPQFFDIASFQVLKGPQGTLFGRSTTGGAVVIVPQGVQDRLGGYGRIQGGNYGDVQAEGAINLPLADGLAGLRLAGFYWKRDGYGRIFPGNVDRLHGTSLDGERYNNQDVLELRGTLKLTPADGFENSTIMTYHSDDNRGSAGAGLINPPGAAVAVPARGYYSLWSNSDVRFHDQARNRALMIVNTTTVDVADSLSLKNIFGYIHGAGMTSQASNPDGTELSTISLPATDRLVKTDQYTDELQAKGSLLDERLKWIVGALADLTRQPADLAKLDVQSHTYNGVCGANCVIMKTTYGSNRNNSYGAFVSGSFAITPRLAASGGFRRSWDSVAFYTGDILENVIVSPSAHSPLNPLPASALRTLKKRFAGNTHNADISYKFSRSTLIYAGYRHGYKRGGFQPSAPTSAEAGFDPETVDTYFGGIKSDFELAGHRFRANVELYHDAYKGQQISYLTRSVAPVNALVSRTTNVDKSTYNGVDVELNAEIVKGWTLNAKYSYIDAKNNKWIDRSTAVVTTDLTKNPIPYVSRNKITAFSRAEIETGVGIIALQGTANYESKSYSGPTCHVYPQSTQNIFGPFDIIAHGGCVVPKRTTFDGRIELNNVGGTSLSLAANVVNLTNKIYVTGTSNTLLYGVEGFSYGAPRTWSVEAFYKF